MHAELELEEFKGVGPIERGMLPEKKQGFFQKLMKKNSSPKGGGCYSKDEWQQILDSRCLLFPLDHYKELRRAKMPIEVDRKRVKHSLLSGSIPNALRGPIWKLISRVDEKRQMYNPELF